MIVSIVMPVYNEKNTIAEVVRLVQAPDIEKEIIIVDDFSTDGTREIIEKIDGNNVKKVFCLIIWVKALL